MGRSHLGVGLLLALPACLASQTRAEHDRLLALVYSEARPGRASRSIRTAPDDPRLAREASLALILRLALERSPEPAAARARVRASLAAVPASARLPDLELSTELGGVPLARPHRLDEAEMIRIGLRQTFPAPSSLGARAQLALEEARGANAEEAARTQDLATRVRRAYFDLYRLEREQRVLREHLVLVGQMLLLARAGTRAGLGNQQEPLSLIVEETRIRTELIGTERGLASSRALLNALMVRRLDAPLGPTPELPGVAELDLAELESELGSRSPELQGARAALARSQAALAASQAQARWPSFMVGLDYWLMPMGEHKHGYGAMLGINLPWLSVRRREEVREKEQARTAAALSLEAAELEARFALRAALLRYRAERDTLALLEAQLLPQASRSFEAARAAYAVGQGSAVGLIDAFRGYLQIRLERVRSKARIAAALAGLERAAGRALPAPGEERRRP